VEEQKNYTILKIWKIYLTFKLKMKVKRSSNLLWMMDQF